MSGTFISSKEKTMQLKFGALVLVIWKTYRWRVVFYAGHHRFVIL